MQFTNGYYSAMERWGETPPVAAEKRTDIPLDDPNFKSSLGPQDLGATLNPFQHPIQAMHARLREGVGKIEFEFFGAGKGSKERFTPESIGSLERADLKALAEINDLKTSVHGTVAITGMAGLGKNGFDENQRQEGFNEIRRAIDFAADVTKGGAIVLHTGEWQRSIHDKWGKQGFEGFPNEENKATLFVVRNDTGEFVSSISKDRTIYEPKYWTAETKAKDYGFTKLADGRYQAPDGTTMYADDYVDIHGKFINPTDTDRLFERVPEWDEKHTRFNTNPLEWKDIERRTRQFNERYNEHLKPEEYFAKTQIENQILQAKGHSLFYAQRYDKEKQAFEEAKRALEYYRKLEKEIPESEVWKIMRKEGPMNDLLEGFSEESKYKKPSELLTDFMKHMELSMRHVHESSAAMDVQAKSHEDTWNKIESAEDYGLRQSADTIARLGIFAMDKTRQKKLEDPLYVAPENWHPQQFGSHPEELRELILASRKKMEEELTPRYGKTEAEKLAKDHIKATLDIGHLNIWRKHFTKKGEETLEQTDKRFNDWMLKQTEKLAKEGIIGHIHVSDNMGYDDEHLTPGQGNVPIKAFMKKMEEAGLKDFLIEVGSFNPVTSLPDTLSYLGSPVSAGTRFPQIPTTFAGIQTQHFGYQSPPYFIAGAYSPSNEWKLWSEVPFE